MSILTILVLVAGIIAFVFGVINNEFRSSTFWFLTSFWLYLVFSNIGPMLR